MRALTVTARLVSSDSTLLPKVADTAEVEVTIPMPESWAPAALIAVFPSIAETMSDVLRSWRDDDRVEEFDAAADEVVFTGGES